MKKDKDPERSSYDDETEKSVLGAILIDNKALSEVKTIISVSDFYSTNHINIFSAMLELEENKKGIDFLTLKACLEKKGLNYGGPPYLASLVDFVPTAANVKYHAEIVRDESTKRKFKADKQAAEIHLKENRFEDALLLIEKLKACASENGYKPKAPINDVELSKKIFQPRKIIIPNLIFKGLNILAGKPKMGKSVLSRSIAYAISCGGHVLGKIKVDLADTLFCALEDSEDQLSEYRAVFGPPQEHLYWETDLPRLGKGCIEYLEAWIRSVKNPGFIVIDTIARIKPRPDKKSGTQYDEDTDIAVPLQKLAFKYNIAILTNHHMRKALPLDDPLDAVSGSVGVVAVPDNVITLTGIRGEPEAVLGVYSRTQSSHEYMIKFDTGQWYLVGDAAEQKVSKERLDILKLFMIFGKDLKPSEIAKELGKTVKTIWYLIGKLEEEGYVINTVYGKYTITRWGEEQARVLLGDYKGHTKNNFENNFEDDSWNFGNKN